MSTLTDKLENYCNGEVEVESPLEFYTSAVKAAIPEDVNEAITTGDFSAVLNYAERIFGYDTYSLAGACQVTPSAITRWKNGESGLRYPLAQRAVIICLFRDLKKRYRD